MAFSATLYNCPDDPKTLNKILSNADPVNNIVPTENCDILNPTFVLSYKQSYTTCNYIVVDAPFNRSYFITDMKIDIGKKIIITCAVDVLGTYKEDIKKIETTIYRNEDFKTSAPYVADNEYQVKSGFQYFYETFKIWKDGQQASPAFSGHGDDGEGGDDEPYRYVLSWVGHEISPDANYYEITSEPSDWATSWGDYYYRDSTGETPAYYSLLVQFPYRAPEFSAAKNWAYTEYQSGLYANISQNP